MTLRSVEARIGRITLDRYHGMYEHTPTLAGMFMLTGLASIGFPGTLGFVGMELLIEGAVGVFPFVGLAVLMAATLNGIAIMRAYFRIFTGRRFQTTAILRSRASERFALLVLTFLVLGGGLWPQPGVASRYHAAQELLRLRMNPEQVIEPDDEAVTHPPDQEKDVRPQGAIKKIDVPEPEAMLSVPTGNPIANSAIVAIHQLSQVPTCPVW